MSETRPFASLSPALLARKGGARPAMRPQIGVQPNLEATARQLDDEDLGWNDLGESGMDEAGNGDACAGEVVSLNVEFASQASVSVPEVHRQQQDVVTRLAAPQRKSAFGSSRRSAFTLRLDADRHLRLRLAATLAGRSAQQLVTEAIDQFLAALPQVEDLAVRAGKRR